MRLITVIAAAALGLVAACDKGPERRADTAQPPASASGGGSTSASGGASATANTPANIGQPQSSEERKEGTNPVQGQVDPKQGEQHKDFQHRGDGSGPKSPDTAPKRGG